jgi:hypothetical protein
MCSPEAAQALKNPIDSEKIQATVPVPNERTLDDVFLCVSGFRR